MTRHLEHFANRVALVLGLGATWGYLQAQSLGHFPGRSAALTAMSCGIVATTCFGIERGTTVVLENTIATSGVEDTAIPRLYRLLFTHTIAGSAGGAILGTLYQKRPFNGMLLCVPLMLMVGYGESMFQDLVDEKQREAQMKKQLQ